MLSKLLYHQDVRLLWQRKSGDLMHAGNILLLFFSFYQSFNRCCTVCNKLISQRDSLAQILLQPFYKHG